MNNFDLQKILTTDTDKFFDTIFSYLSPNSHATLDFRTIQSTYTRIKKEKLLGIISSDDYNRFLNQVIYNSLTLLREIETEVNQNNNKSGLDVYDLVIKFSKIAIIETTSNMMHVANGGSQALNNYVRDVIANNFQDEISFDYLQEKLNFFIGRFLVLLEKFYKLRNHVLMLDVNKIEVLALVNYIMNRLIRLRNKYQVEEEKNELESIKKSKELLSSGEISRAKYIEFIKDRVEENMKKCSTMDEVEDIMDDYFKMFGTIP